jgi:hypothetical protein
VDAAAGTLAAICGGIIGGAALFAVAMYCFYRRKIAVRSASLGHSRDGMPARNVPYQEF